MYSVQDIRNNNPGNKIKISKSGNDEDIKEVKEIEKDNSKNKNFSLKINDDTKDKKLDKKKKRKLFCEIL